MHTGAASFRMCLLQWAAGLHSIVEGATLKDQIKHTALRQRAIPALAIVCALATKSSEPLTAWLFESLRFCLLVSHSCVPW